MIVINQKKCKGCGQCEIACPLNVIKIIDKKAAIVNNNCVNCKACIKLCKSQAILEGQTIKGSVICTNCGVNCEIPEGLVGACRRFINVNGKLVRNKPLNIPEKKVFDRKKEVISRPLITAVGAGAAYPDYHPAPYIVESEVEGFDVVTAVTEAPISYSSMVVKIDTDKYIGNEGSLVRRNGKVVGMVVTEQYGSHILIIGGINRVKSNDGLMAVKTMVELGNRGSVQLKIDKGSLLELEFGKHPIVDGNEDFKMRVGCGGACCGLFAKYLAKLVNEAIILDHHITGLLTQHPAGAELLSYSGVVPVGRFATPGRYFLEHGQGWGGTNIKNPRQAIKYIDKKYSYSGMKILVTETTWRKAALFELKEVGELIEIPLTPELEEFRRIAASNCEESQVSVTYCAGVGGSARAGITVNPIELTKAVHRGDAILTIAGAPTFVLPGGGITFFADVEKMIQKPFTYTPSPAVVAPVEYTILRSKYKKIGGHIISIKSLSDVLKEGRFQWVRTLD